MPGWCRKGCRAMPTAFSFAGTRRQSLEGGRPVDPLKKRNVAFATSFSPVTLAHHVPFILGLPIQNQHDLLRVYVKKHKTRNSMLTALHFKSSNGTFISRGARRRCLVSIRKSAPPRSSRSAARSQPSLVFGTVERSEDLGRSMGPSIFVLDIPTHQLILSCILVCFFFDFLDGLCCFFL